MLSGASLRSVSETTPFSLASASRHMTNHVRGPLQVHADDDALVGTTPATFASRLLEIADDARRLRVHARNNSNPSVMLRAMAAERDALTQLTAGLGVDEESVVGALADADVLVSAVVDAMTDHPELGEAVAAAYDRTGDLETAQTIRAMAEDRATRLRLVPIDGGPR